MEEVVFSNTKVYKNIAERRSVGFPHIEKALNIVKEFIIKKKRIVYGGMCLDLALKMVEHPGIYSDNTLPDYDFMTPEFYNESNELADILFNEGLPNVSAINAAHFSSRRVRVNFVSVADLSYVPSNIFESLPYLVIPDNIKSIKQYKGLRILHPTFQRNDMHRAFNIPFSNPPQEVILHRLEKDQKRFRLLDIEYPISIDKKYLKNNAIFDEKKLSSYHKLVLPKKYANNGVIGGIFDYAILLKIIKQLISPTSSIYPDLEKGGVLDFCYEKLLEIIQVEIKITNDEFILYTGDDLKEIININILTDNFPKLIDNIKKDYKNIKIVYYNKFLDNLRPRTIYLTDTDFKYEIFDCKGELLPCYNLQKTINMLKKILGNDNEYLLLEENNDTIFLAQPNTILLYFLEKSFDVAFKKTPQKAPQKDSKNSTKDFSDSLDDNIYKSMYKSTMNLVEIAEKIHLALEEENPDVLKKIYKYLPFYLPVHTYGEYNWSTDYVSSVKDKKSFLGIIPEKECLRPPFGYYPESKNELIISSWIPFDPETSELYQIDGLARLEPFNAISLN